MRTFIFKYLFVFLIASQSWASNEKLLKQIEARAKETGSDSLVIIQNNKTIVSDFFGGDDAVRNVQSVTKSISALAIGILLDEGKIKSLDIPMSHWVPAWANDPQKSLITLRMIMSQTSGLPHGDYDFVNGPDMIRSASEIPLEFEPGSRFKYSNVGVALLQTVIAQSSGESVESFVKERIFTPLSITDSSWKKDSLGHERTSGGLNLSTRDLIKIGQLMLNHGSYNGVQIISPQCEALLLEQSQSYKEYGLLWWRRNDLLYAMGWGGQFIIVDPTKNLIAVRTRRPTTVDPDELDAQYFRDFVELVDAWE